jgi:hypothetical protein
MVTLYYLNKNNDIETMELPVFDACVPLKESGIFIAYRDGINFVKNPPDTFPFTDLERLIIGTEFFDTNYIKESDYRKQNSSFCPVVPVQVSLLQVFDDVFINQSEGNVLSTIQCFDVQGLEPIEEEDKLVYFSDSLGVFTAFEATKINGDGAFPMYVWYNFFGLEQLPENLPTSVYFEQKSTGLKTRIFTL